MGTKLSFHLLFYAEYCLLTESACFFWTDVSGAVLNARFYAVNATRIPPEINEGRANKKKSISNSFISLDKTYNPILR